MKILVLAGSPHRNGTSNTLVAHFVKGAESAGHEVEIYDTAKGKINPCLGCDICGMNGKCIQRDDGNEVLAKILKADILVFATPVYYFGMSAQLKTMIDRFYARTGQITRKHLKSILIATSWNDDGKVMKDIDSHFDTIFDYMDMECIGKILAKGSGTVSMMPQHYLKEAYTLGKSIKMEEENEIH